eukprot:TRINITY_DN8468_c0_g1_i1.p1 TRINITY_DN8468_c0_g1~~TRINITY_DN8468_c0_g1_i1.p1  ORF type:complete len:311 (-),score=66.47 TRINITY_DN8468_c0_g1_i1:52-984(-)
MVLLERLGLGVNAEDFRVVVTDTFAGNGGSTVVLEHLIHSVNPSTTGVIYIALESLRLWRTSLSKSSNVSLIDAVSNPYGWDSVVEDDVKVNSSRHRYVTLDDEKALFEAIQNAHNDLASSERVLVVVDALNMLESHWAGEKSVINSFLRRFCHSSWIFAAHLDCVSPDNSKLIHKLEYYATGSVNVQSTQAGVLNARIVLRPALKSMKFLHSAGQESFHILDHGHLKFFKDSTTDGGSGGSSTAQISQVALDPTANLTFNLKLTQEQRQAKDSVVLPYMHKQEVQTVQRHVDLDDDFDEEDDPDYDLEI